MVEKSDWRLNGQEEYLQGKTLHYRKWGTDATKHDHCIFCWEKFSGFEGALHEGYVTDDERHWICPECFRDFQVMFGWVTDGEKNGQG